MSIFPETTANLDNTFYAVIPIGKGAFLHKVIYKVAEVVPRHFLIDTTPKEVGVAVELANRGLFDGLTHKVLNGVHPGRALFLGKGHR